jgi:hypothetical protein
MQHPSPEAWQAFLFIEPFFEVQCLGGIGNVDTDAHEIVADCAREQFIERRIDARGTVGNLEKHFGLVLGHMAGAAGFGCVEDRTQCFDVRFGHHPCWVILTGDRSTPAFHDCSRDFAQCESRECSRNAKGLRHNVDKHLEFRL